MHLLWNANRSWWAVNNIDLSAPFMTNALQTQSIPVTRISTGRLSQRGRERLLLQCFRVLTGDGFWQIANLKLEVAPGSFNNWCIHWGKFSNGYLASLFLKLTVWHQRATTSHIVWLAQILPNFLVKIIPTQVQYLLSTDKQLAMPMSGSH